MMSGFLLAAVVGAPAVAAMLMVVLSPPAATAGKWAVRGSAVAVVGAVGSLILTGADAAPTAVLELTDGHQVGLVADRATATIAVLTAAVSLVVQSFATRSLRGDPRASRFFVSSCLLTAATASTAVSADAIGLGVAWLATSVALTGLLRHRYEWDEAHRAARLTARTFVLGDLALLTAIAIATSSLGGIDLRALEGAARALESSRLDIFGAGWDRLDAVAVLLVIGGLCRSALIPAHRWLPATLAAPTPVSALLHAGVVNGIGVLLIRFSPVVGSSSAAMSLAFATGAVTAIIATAIMLIRTDVKGSLVWSTAGQMGFMTVQLGVGAFGAALFHLIGHAMYKASLFLGAGGSISASARRRHFSEPPKTVGRTTRTITAAVMPMVGLVAAIGLVDPSGSSAAKVLIGFFGWVTGARLVEGWLLSAPMSPSTAAATVLLGAGWPLAYVSAVTVFERFVGSAAPMNAPGAVTTPWLIGTIIVAAAGAAPLTMSPVHIGLRWRRRVFATLVGWGIPAYASRAAATSSWRHRAGGSGDSAVSTVARRSTRRSASG